MPDRPPDRSRDRQALIRNELQRVDGRAPDPHAPLPKHRKMAADPFRFLRGAAQLFYADLGSGLLSLPDRFAEPRLRSIVMGDCHLSNFGFMTEEGSTGRRVIFAPNDFDDACAAPAAWDLARFATSLFLAAAFARGILDTRFRSDAAAGPQGLAAPQEADAAAAALAFLAAYRATCEAVVADPERRMAALESFPSGHVLHKPGKKARRRAAGGRDFLTKSSLGKAAELTSQGPRFRERPDRFGRLDSDLATELRAVFRPYVDDEILDLVARLDAGTGSAGMDRYYLLVGPGDFAGAEDMALCHVVEVKRQRQAAPLHRFPGLNPMNRLNPAHLTVDCQRLMQRRPDLVLDEVAWRNAHWLVRSRHHARVCLDPEDVCLTADGDPAARLADYARACGEALALAHSRGDRRSTRFEAAMADTLARDGEALAVAARGYAAQSAADCEALREMLAVP